MVLVGFGFAIVVWVVATCSCIVYVAVDGVNSTVGALVTNLNKHVTHYICIWHMT